ncbi:MAG: family 78 glycoside hydrolase catalytic domain [Clostridia bacterium]|nr:family 78 glycoside hydrolase catalytic domain [Clostridia bacterium]
MSYALPLITTQTFLEYPQFFRRFEARDVLKATLTVTGLGVFRCEINGQRVGQDYLTPGFNDYDAYLRVYTYDVTDLLASSNELCVTLGKGWCMSRLGPNSGDPDHWGHRYVLGAQLTLEHASGSTTVLETDESWRARRSVITMSELYDGEHRDDTVSCTETVPCRYIQDSYHLEAPVSPPIREIGLLKPKLIITPRGETVLDFQQNFAGIIRFRNFLPKGKSMLIQTGEVLQEGCFYRENLLTAKSEYRYTSDGREKTVEPWFCFYGFRYARITCDEPVHEDDFTGVVLSSSLRETLSCSTDHALLNRLLENARWSLRSNFLDVPTDCPQRDERLGWLGDAQVFARTACFLCDCRDFYRKFLRDMREEQVRYYAGNLPMYVPSLRGEAGPGGAVWADAGTIIPWEVYMASGDLELLREAYPLMHDYTEVLIRDDLRLGGTHVIFDAFTFGDWLSQDGITEKSVFGGTSSAYIQGVYYYSSVSLTGNAAEALGLTEDADRYRTLAQDIRGALMRTYVTEYGHLSVDTQTGYILALRHGLYRKRDIMVQDFRNRLRLDGYRIRCGFTGAPLMISTMFEAGMVDDACRLLLREDFPGWLYEVRMGATTIWERWNSMLPDGTVSDTGMNSFNHYAYGAVCSAVYEHVMGLRCLSPGWRRAEIAPKVNGRIRRSAMTYDSPCGRFEVSWAILDDGQVEMDAVVPEGAEAVIIPPDHPEGLHATVRGERWHLRYTPARDYLHPFDRHSLILDLVECENAAQRMKEMCPTLYTLATDPLSDVCTKHLDELSWGVPKAAKKEAAAFMETVHLIRR